MKKMFLLAGVVLVGLVVGCGGEKKPAQAPTAPNATMDAMKDKANTPTPPAGTTDDKKP